MDYWIIGLLGGGGGRVYWPPSQIIEVGAGPHAAPLPTPMGRV